MIHLRPFTTSNFGPKLYFSEPSSSYSDTLIVGLVFSFSNPPGLTPPASCWWLFMVRLVCAVPTIRARALLKCVCCSAPPLLQLHHQQDIIG